MSIEINEKISPHNSQSDNSPYDDVFLTHSHFVHKSHTNRKLLCFCVVYILFCFFFNVFFFNFVCLVILIQRQFSIYQRGQLRKRQINTTKPMQTNNDKFICIPYETKDIWICRQAFALLFVKENVTDEKLFRQLQ